jgi:hypothetical protein
VTPELADEMRQVLAWIEKTHPELVKPWIKAHGCFGPCVYGIVDGRGQFVQTYADARRAYLKGKAAP